MDLNPYLQFKDESTYLFCHEVSYILETGIIGYMLNILLNADFSAKLWQKKMILDRLSCQIKMNAMNLLLGVSGSGKSTLLKAFSNKTGRLPPNYQGQIFLPKSYLKPKEDISKPKLLYLAYVSQWDSFHEVFTIQEQLEMVFELKYANKDLRERVLDSAMLNDTERRNVDKAKLKQKLVQSLLDELNLQASANTKIKFCSGGEKKRLSIAVELIALPDIMLLDEPTTGLDSSTSLQIIGLLDRYTRSGNLTVLTVLHQPSFPLFKKFNNVIVQDKNGQNLYNGPPLKLATYLKSFGLACPKDCNPADFILDVANGDFDELQIREKLAIFQRERHDFMLKSEVFQAFNGAKQTEEKAVRNVLNLNGINLNGANPNDVFLSLPKIVLRNCSFYWRHLRLLIGEAFKIELTDSLLLYLKACVYVMNLFTFHIGFGLANGKYDGCPNQNLTKQFEPSLLSEVLKFNKENLEATISTTGNLYFTVFIASYSTAALPVILIPNELKIFIKQLNNQWYSFGCYYLSRVLADLPIIIAFVIAYGSLNVLLTGISSDFERYACLMLTYIVCGIFIHTAAFLIGGAFIDSANASMYIIVVGSLPLASICERTKLQTGTSNIIIKGLVLISYVKYAFRGLAIALYGDRCDLAHKDAFVNYTIDMKDWLNEKMKVKTADDDADFQGSGVTEAFTDNLVKLINGEYFNRKNSENPYELRSMILNKLEFADLRYVDTLYALGLEIIVARILSILLTSFLIKRKIF